jgi:bifunctional enzyme CysN/CysC
LKDIKISAIKTASLQSKDALREIETAKGQITLLKEQTRDDDLAGEHRLTRTKNIHTQAFSINRAMRENQNGHTGKVIWFTGLSGSGKSTLANALELELHERGKHTYLLDGDNIRQGLNKDLGFTDADRFENIRRIAEVAKLMTDAGLIVITAFISPFKQGREMAKQLIGKENFIEVFVDTPIEVCEERDPKGLYKKAREGNLPNFSGISSPYEAPENPDITLDGSQIKSKTYSLKKILEFLSKSELT